MFECCGWIILILIALAFLNSVYGLIFLHRLTEVEIIEEIGFDWKSTLQIREGLIKKYSNKFGQPRPFLSTGFLYIKLDELVKQGWLVCRTVPGGPERGYHPRMEFRRTAKRLPAQSKKIYNWRPQLALTHS